MDTEQWPQEIGLVKPMEEMEMVSSCSRPMLERRMRPQKEQALNCPRCNSTNTKFCYYNNYSLSQPRYFCKTCRRYWTEGGSLRNVPVGGGSRKNKRSSSSKKITTDLTAPNSDATSNPSNIQEGQDLNLAFPNSQEYHRVNLPIENNSSNNPPCSSSSSSSLSNMELLRSGFGSRSLNIPYMPIQDPNTYPSLGFGLHDFNRSNLNVAADGFSGYGNFQDTGRVLFPFEDLRQVSNTELDESKVQGDSAGYWNGMLGGGSWSQVPNYGP